MMVMTAKVDFKKILIGLAAAAGVIVALIALLGGKDTPTTATAGSMSANDSRVAYLAEMGWQVDTTPKESGQVKIPQEQSTVFTRYNDLQKSQGFDLSPLTGQTVMRYVYKVNNFPNATDPVYATLLVHKDKIIGGDVTDTSAKGKILPLKRQDVSVPEESLPTTESTAPTM